MSHQELHVLFDGAGAEELADRLIDFVESELEGEASGGLYDPAAVEWPGDEAAVVLEDEHDLGEDADDEEAAQDGDHESDDLDDADGAADGGDEAEGAGFLVTLSRSCFEVSGELGADDAELRASALLEWLDEETKHLPNVRVDLWLGSDADGAQALEEMDSELLLEMLEASSGG